MSATRHLYTVRDAPARALRVYYSMTLERLLSDEVGRSPRVGARSELTIMERPQAQHAFRSSHTPSNQ